MQQDSNRKIIGYKAPIDMKSIDITKDEIVILAKCGKLYRKNDRASSFYGIAKELVEATWQAVYEEEFKKGDILVVTEAQSPVWTKGKIFTFKEYGDSGQYIRDLEGVGSVSSTACRKATPAEIEEFTTVKIGAYKTEKASSRTIKFGCEVFNIEQLSYYKHLLLRNEKAGVNIKLNVNGVDITVEILDKLLKMLS